MTGLLALAKKAGIPAQALLQSYLNERLLERLSRPKRRDEHASSRRRDAPENHGLFD